MDSFYEQPREAPASILPQNVPSAPVVPEVSMIFKSNPSEHRNVQNVEQLSYNAWKARNKQQFPLANRIGFNTSDSARGAFASGIDSQKHVRFESPCYQGTHFPITSRENMENIPPQTNQQNSNNSNLPPFEKIYMANVPNRHLDLSIIEPTKVNHNKYRGDYQEPSERSLRIINNNQKPIEPTYRHNQSRPGIEMHEHFPRDNLLNGNTKSPKVQDFNKDMLGRNIVYNNSKKGEPIVDMYNYKRANVLETDRQIVENMQLGEYTRQNQVFSGMVNNKVDIRGRVSQENRCSPCSEPVIRRDSFGADILSNLRKNEDIQTRNDKVDNQIATRHESDEPSVKDLMKQIQQQNEHILMLQKQMTAIMEMQQRPRQIEPPPFEPAVHNFGKCCITSSRYGHDPLSAVMTSRLEVTVHHPHNRNPFYKEPVGPRIEEIVETSSSGSGRQVQSTEKILGSLCDSNMLDDDTKIDDSLVFGDSLVVRESCPTPQGSIHVDMKDYSSSSDSSSNEDEESGSLDTTSWTIYNKIMGQVNKMLKTPKNRSRHASPHGSSEEPHQNISDVPLDKARKEKIMNKVKEATAKRLKSIGVNVPLEEGLFGYNGFSDGRLCNPNEVSFTVKQLLMKYLPDDQLGKIAYTQVKTTPAQTGGEGMNLIKRRPDFSIATVQYMQKYNLLTSEGNKVASVTQPTSVFPAKKGTDRVLDITALKQQRKLL